MNDPRIASCDVMVESATKRINQEHNHDSSTQQMSGLHLKECKVVLDNSMCFPVKDKSGKIIQGKKCLKCGKVFTNSRQLRAHRTLHTECSPYDFQCEFCLRKFEKEAGLDQHQRRFCKVSLSRRNFSNSAQGVSIDRVSTDSDPPARTDRKENHVSQGANNVKSRYVLEDEKNQLGKIPVKAPIKWPPLRDRKIWKRFDENVVRQLDENGSFENRIHRL